MNRPSHPSENLQRSQSSVCIPKIFKTPQMILFGAMVALAFTKNLIKVSVSTA